jgi:hypothetical protein
MVALHDIPWFQRAGEPITEARVARVAGWRDALAIVEGGHLGYSERGILLAPKHAVIDALDREPSLRERADTAAAEALRRMTASLHVPASVPAFTRLALADHVASYCRLLVTEFVVQEVTTCTYFRDQLVWWRAGHFPCGWDGAWPAGAMRVY